MKLIHLSDLHLGKRVNEFSVIEDQEYILRQILSVLDQEKPDAVLIAGDVYDKTVPSAEAVKLCSWFLLELVQRKLQVFLSSGNHDSAERLAFGREIFDQSGIHISPVYDGMVKPATLTDAWGEVDVYMLPFVKPSVVRHFFPEAEIETYTDAVRVAIEQMEKIPGRRKVLLAHQFVTGSQTSDSEISVGGLDNVDADVFDDFHYVALGHLHRPQTLKPHIRYCGTPLKYSFSEVHDQKSVTVVELDEQGSAAIRTVPLTPLRDMVELKGTFEEVMAPDFYAHKEYYVRVILTDEEEIPDVMGRVRQRYPNLMRFEYDNSRTRKHNEIQADRQVTKKDPLTVFAELYQLQNNQPMGAEQTQFLQGLIESIWEGEA